MLALLTTTGTAQAGSYSGHLPGKTWTTNGAFETLDLISGTDSAGLSICVTPAEFSGSWSFPYGWACGSGYALWDSGTVAGYPAVDNPNSREFSFTVEYA
jgi:hypothetical protein